MIRASELAIPPMEFRRLIGQIDPTYFDNPSRRPIFEGVPDTAYDTVLDFGCGCGRVARQLIQQEPRPNRYIGIDRHRAMIDWCRSHLTPHAPGFDFKHHDVFHMQLNPGGTPGHLALPAVDAEISLFVGISIFTHLLEADAEFYLGELGRVLSPRGVAVTTWFLFDKEHFPMMQEFQNALMINPLDLTNAVIFDRAWLAARASAAGLVITRITPPEIRGFHWWIQFERAANGRNPAAFPPDAAPTGIVRPPLSEHG